MQTDTTPDLETEKGGVVVFTLALKIKGGRVHHGVIQGHGMGKTRVEYFGSGIAKGRGNFGMGKDSVMTFCGRFKKLSKCKALTHCSAGLG